jgi:two-component system, chemotaxis family, protein-glutamate methylesterase/glutaminase
MINRDIIVAGASAGGVPALIDFVKNIPSGFQASIFIVLHMPAYSESKLPQILNTAGPLEAAFAKDGEKIKKGKIYIAPNDYHLLLENNHMIVKKGPKENRFRPSVDALFRSAAYEYGPRVVGIVLSGVLNDGSSGLWTIKRQGGTAIIQDPGEAQQPQMPTNTLEYLEPDYIVPASELASVLVQLQNQTINNSIKLSPEEMQRLKMEVYIASRDNAFEMGVMNMGELTPFTCPECSGTLVKLLEGNILRFRCHTGHAYTASALLTEVSESVEKLLWQSIRALEETHMLLNSISEQYTRMNDESSSSLFKEKAETALQRSAKLRELVFEQEPISEDMRLENHKKK